MTTETANQAFKQEVEKVSQKYLTKLQDEMIKQHDELITQFNQCFKQYCRQIVTLQQSGAKNPLGYIQFSLMRSKIITGEHAFRIDAYDQDGYADQALCVGAYDVTPIFSHLDQFGKELQERRRKYMQKVTVCQVKQLVLEESDTYKLAVTALIRSALPKAIETADYQKVKREDLFVITVGEFRDQVELVYKEDRTEKDVEKMKHLLGTTKEEGHQYEVFDGLDLSGGQFAQTSWLYCSGKNSTFAQATLSTATLMFCQFEGATFKSVDFSHSDLIGIDFTNATLEAVDFTGARMLQVNFSGATLKQIDFTTVDQIKAIDLTDATLIDVRRPDEMGVE
ncbi:MAG: pentapeptide repeat-containing protein [Defluviitaleaceae bacterium]|nr:pentapeptide repeat-containing protein [Defluviitaleaceae bacterium]